MSVPRRVTSAACLATLMLGSAGRLDAEPETKAWKKDSPVSIAIDYTLASDYIWRGIDFSEYPGEGREKLNHQLGSGLGIDTPIGTLGAYVWFQWYQGQQHINPDQNDHLQEIDYTLNWGYEFGEIGTSVELGWISYTFPHLSGDTFATYEYYGKVSFDESVLFGFPVISPFVYWGLDYDLGNNGSYIEVGGSHEFAASDLEDLSDTPVIKNLSVTPSITMAIDWRYLHNFALKAAGNPHRTIAYVAYGLEVAYDLGASLTMPARYGSLGLGTFIKYNQAVRRDILNDELYGGLTVSYAW